MHLRLFGWLLASGVLLSNGRPISSSSGSIAKRGIEDEHGLVARADNIVQNLISRSEGEQDIVSRDLEKRARAPAKAAPKAAAAPVKKVTAPPKAAPRPAPNRAAQKAAPKANNSRNKPAPKANTSRNKSAPKPAAKKPTAAARKPSNRKSAPKSPTKKIAFKVGASRGKTTGGKKAASQSRKTPATKAGKSNKLSASKSRKTTTSKAGKNTVSKSGKTTTSKSRKGYTTKAIKTGKSKSGKTGVSKSGKASRTKAGKNIASKSRKASGSRSSKTKLFSKKSAAKENGTARSAQSPDSKPRTLSRPGEGLARSKSLETPLSCPLRPQKRSPQEPISIIPTANINAQLPNARPIDLEVKVEKVGGINKAHYRVEGGSGGRYNGWWAHRDKEGSKIQQNEIKALKHFDRNAITGTVGTIEFCALKVCELVSGHHRL
ncbi:hypothetical protein CPB86DRAFT_256807 [Serendipita vermifera]|nr:hypothetical protein CPB86DRAFT_256807 [Serendipita vermifera]